MAGLKNEVDIAANATRCGELRDKACLVNSLDSSKQFAPTWAITFKLYVGAIAIHASNNFSLSVCDNDTDSPVVPATNTYDTPVAFKNLACSGTLETFNVSLDVNGENTAATNPCTFNCSQFDDNVVNVLGL